MDEIKTAPAPDPVEARPAPKWHVWWQARRNQRGAMCSVCGLMIALTPGQIYRSHCRVFPSKDTAETWARELIAIMQEQLAIDFGNNPLIFWAMPVGERPWQSEGEA